MRHVAVSNLVRTDVSRPMRLLARMLWGALIGSALALFIVPWQQSVRGFGRVIAYAPLERQQTIEAPIEGRVVHWFVQEGQRVKKGQPIAELSDNDPQILARLQREYEATRDQVDAALLSMNMTENRIASLQAARDAAIMNAKLRVQMAEDRQNAAERSVHAAEAALKTAQLNRTRLQNLHEQGLSSTRELELAELAYQKADTDLDRSKAQLDAARREIRALHAEQKKIASSQNASIEATRSSLQSLVSSKAKSQADLVKVETRLQRQRSMRIEAPRDGAILRLVAKQGGEMVKSGDALVILVPDTNARAVELWVNGNDAPLITSGRNVRLQFEGWPAVQFMGWPSVAIGTFPGKVAFVDASDDGGGRFRVVVVPHKKSDWPEGRYLRQGVRAKAWVLLNQVRLGYEIWRQLNGFPPSIQTTPSLGYGSKADRDKSSDMTSSSKPTSSVK